MKPHLLTDFSGNPAYCNFGITEAAAALFEVGTSLFAADAGATGLAAAGAGAADAAAGVSLADLGVEAGAAGLGAADVGLGAADAAGGISGLGADIGASGSSLGFAGTTGAAAANPLADLSAAGLTAPGVAGGAAPVAAGPVDLASSFSAASDSLNPLNWTGFSITDPATGVTSGGTFTDAGVSTGGVTAGGASPLSTSGGLSSLETATTTAPTSAASGGTDLASLSSAPAADAAGGKAVASGGNIFDNLVSGATKQITSNPIGLGIGAAGLGYSILEGNKTSAEENALKASAGAQAGQSAQLQSYLTTGTLPPGMQAQVDQASAAAKARIISGYASRGQNADPSQNSALAQELAGVDTNAIALQGQLATNLLNAGIQETGMSNQLYEALIQMDQTQAQNMGKAIANFAGALAPKTSINIGGGSST